MRISSRDRLEIVLSTIEAELRRVEFTAVYPEAARSSADAADDRHRRGISIGPLDGLIVTIKDLFDIAGEVTNAGASVRRHAPAAIEDAKIVSALRLAGAVILAKTNMSEFAFSGVGINRSFGTPPNSLNPMLVPGGSSSGAAVSVANGSAEIAIGTDTGGSCRIPAALNGIVGFKPSHGLLSTRGCFPLAPSLDTVGPLARTVAGCSEAVRALAKRPLDPLSPRDPHDLNLGIARGAFYAEIDSSTEEVMEHAIDRLSHAGVRVTELNVDDMWQDMLAAFPAPLVTIEASAVHREGMRASREEYDPRVADRIQLGASVLAADYLVGMQVRDRLISQMKERIGAFDGLVTPTVPILAPRIDDLEADVERFHRVNRLLLRNTTFGNLFDLCAVSLPLAVGADRSGGLMLQTTAGRDISLLSTAATLERILS